MVDKTICGFLYIPILRSLSVIFLVLSYPTIQERCLAQ